MRNQRYAAGVGLLTSAAVLSVSLGCGETYVTDQRSKAPMTTAAPHSVNGGGSGTVPPPGGAGIPAALGTFLDTSPAAMQAQLSSELAAGTGYRTWKSNQVHFLTTLAVYARSYWNDALVASVARGNTDHPVGAIGILELYADASSPTPSGWAVLAKATDAVTPDAWFSFELTEKNGTFGAPTVNNMGDAGCAGCHTPAPAYIIPVAW